MTKILLLSCQGTFGTPEKPGTVHPELKDICLRFLYNCSQKYIDIIKKQGNLKSANFIVGYDGDGSYGKPPPSYYLLMIVLCLLKEGVSSDRIRLAQSQNVTFTESFEKLSGLIDDIPNDIPAKRVYYIQHLRKILNASNNIYIMNKTEGEVVPYIISLCENVFFSYVKPTIEEKYKYGGIDENGISYASTGGWVNWLKSNPGDIFYLPAWHNSLVNIDKDTNHTYQDSITKSIDDGCNKLKWENLGDDETIVLDKPQYKRDTLNVNVNEIENEISKQFKFSQKVSKIINFTGGMKKRTINKKKIKRKSIKKIKRKNFKKNKRKNITPFKI